MLTIEDTGLLVIDIQGRLARIVADSDSMISQTAKLVKGAKALSLPILWVEQNQQRLGETVSEIGQHLTNIQPLNKFTFDACADAVIAEAIRATRIKHWLVCGIEAHICVYQSCCSLLELGHHVELVSDCISSRQTSHKDLAIKKLLSKGAELTNVEMCLYELVKDCRHPQFSTILKLIK